MSTVNADELQNPFHRLQHRHIHVQIHSVDAFDFQNHMLTQDIGNALRGPSFVCSVGLPRMPLYIQRSGEPHATCSSV